ncbi:Aste57867_11898 [Aphanomyces stellatus]|uniref:Aste57867_11898 protein n=1 Tax=Aphanomyces stellatus TaxID=120398 RepID=A0A485KW57_9STRA|nr:hypothetical protein As57867_011853 [Aphanomyces stellatus]VFT88753.1 Aste57867_11898 [Aphanomyces stellatus]
MEMKRKHESLPALSGVDVALDVARLKTDELHAAATSKTKTRKRTSPTRDNTNENDLDVHNAAARDDPLSDEDLSDGASMDSETPVVESVGTTAFGRSPADPLSPASRRPCSATPFRDIPRPLEEAAPTDTTDTPSTPPKRARNRNPGNLILDLSQMSPVPSPKHTKSDYSNVCSQVTDFLFVGGAVVASQRDVLEAHGITHIINCAATVTPNYFPHVFDYYHLRLRDHVTQDIHQHFYNIFQFIDAARERHGKVFIHCVKGISRSPTMAIAYLMAREHLGLHPALDLVRASRPVIDPNAGFILQLNEWDAVRQHTRKQVTLFRVGMADTVGGVNATRYPLIIGPVLPDQLMTSSTRSPAQEPPQVHDAHATACFVVCSMEAKYCSLWCGRDASDEMVETGKHAMRLLQTYEAFPDTFDVVWSGQEPSAFWSVLAPDHDPNTM